LAAGWAPCACRLSMGRSVVRRCPTYSLSAHHVRTTSTPHPLSACRRGGKPAAAAQPHDQRRGARRSCRSTPGSAGCCCCGSEEEQRRRSRCLLERARDLHLRGAGQVCRPTKRTSSIHALSGSSGTVELRSTAGATRCARGRAPAAGRWWRRWSESWHVGRGAEDAAGHHRPHAGRGQQPAEQHGARRRVPEGLLPCGQGAPPASLNRARSRPSAQ
jgi:hypothetical protein